MNVKQTLLSAIISLAVGTLAAVFSPEARILFGFDERPIPSLTLVPSYPGLSPGQSVEVEVDIDLEIDKARLSCSPSISHDIAELKIEGTDFCEKFRVVAPMPFLKNHSGEVYSEAFSMPGKITLSVIDADNELTGDHKTDLRVSNLNNFKIELSQPTISPEEAIEAKFATNVREIPPGFSCIWSTHREFSIKTSGAGNCSATLIITQKGQSEPNTSLYVEMLDNNGATVSSDSATIRVIESQ